MTLYNFESDKHIHINLDAPVENLKWHQQRLQKLAAAVAMDLSVVTNSIIMKGTNDEEVYNNTSDSNSCDRSNNVSKTTSRQASTDHTKAGY